MSLSRFLYISVSIFSIFLSTTYAAPCAPGQVSKIVDGLEQCVDAPTNAGAGSSENILGISKERLRNGDIGINDIPLMIVSVINFILALAASIAVVALIYHAVRMQLASGITGDSSGVDHAKKGMKGALLGFALSMSGWFLMTKLLELLSNNT